MEPVMGRENIHTGKFARGMVVNFDIPSPRTASLALQALHE